MKITLKVAAALFEVQDGSALHRLELPRFERSRDTAASGSSQSKRASSHEGATHNQRCTTSKSARNA